MIILNAFCFEFSGLFSKAEIQSLRRRRTDISDVGESTRDVGELTVGETTRRRNDRLPFWLTIEIGLGSWGFFVDLSDVCSISREFMV